MDSRPGTPIAVAVATLDRPDALARCLDAVLDGEIAAAEIIVVDQGEDPQTATVIAERARHTALTHLRRAPTGLAASRNAALAAVTAPILAMTDDDCVPTPGWLAGIGRAFADLPVPQAVAGRVLPLGPDRPGLYAVSTRLSTVRADVLGAEPPWRAGTGGNVAVDRRWAERIGGWDERLGAGAPGGAGEDVDFLYRLLSAGARVRYEPAALVYHERQAAARRRATRTSYGRGIGACCGLCLRRGDLGGVRLLAQWAALRTSMLRHALSRSEWQALGEELLVARGTAAGLVYGLRQRP